MIHKDSLKFLKDLKANNSKDWLDKNRNRYEFIKNDMLDVAGELIAGVSSFDKTIETALLDPKKCITRLNRDLRFAKDKTPYKTDYYIVLNKDGKNSPSAFYYLHIEPGNCFVGGGIYNPLPEQLNKIRQEIDYSFAEWTAIITDKSFKKNFPGAINNSGVMAKIPKGFEDNNPAKEFLKMKGFFTKEKISDNEIITTAIRSKIIDCFKANMPLIKFLNKAMDRE